MRNPPSKRNVLWFKKPDSKELPLAVFLVALFNWMWFNKYFTVAEGWFSAYAMRWIEGYIPYKDTALFLPPLYTWQLSVFIRIFGAALINLRVLGAVVMSCLAAALYAIYRRFADPLASCVATVASIIYLESFNVFVPYDYHSFVHLYAVVSVLLLMKASESGGWERESGWMNREEAFLTMAGTAASFCLLTKHSLGVLVVTMDCALVILIFARMPARPRRRAALFFAGGLLLPICVFLAWLYRWSSPRGFYESVILGVGAKGNLRSILFGFYKLQFTRAFYKSLGWALAAALALFVQRRIARAPASQGKHDALSEKIVWLAVVAVLVCLMLRPQRVHVWYKLLEWAVVAVLPLYWFGRITPYPPTWSRNIGLTEKIVWAGTFGFIIFLAFCPYWPESLVTAMAAMSIPFAIIATLIVLIGAGRAFWLRPEAEAFGHFAAACLSCCLMYSSAMSTLISEGGAYVGWGLAICLAWRRLQGVPWAVLLLFLPLMGFTAQLVGSKYNRPYYWWYLNSTSIDSRLAEFDHGLLRGIYTTPEIKSAVEQTVSIIEDNSKSGDFIFTFPSIPIFYLLTDRWPPTCALVHWYDVARDEAVRQDLRRLQEHPPKVIVLLDLLEEAMQVHEDVFRGGRSSAQREVLQWIREQTDSSAGKARYRLENSFRIGDGAVIKVWSRIGGLKGAGQRGKQNF